MEDGRGGEGPARAVCAHDDATQAGLDRTAIGSIEQRPGAVVGRHNIGPAQRCAEKALALLGSHKTPASSWSDAEQYRGEIRRAARRTRDKVRACR